MLPVLRFSFNAIAPILLLILIGLFARKKGFLSEKTLKQLNKFDFRFGFTSLMFTNLYEIDHVSGFSGSMVVVLLLSLVCLTVLGFFITNRVTRDPKRKGVLAQTMFRSNYAIIGLVLVEALAGDSGRELATIFQLPTIIYYNTMSVICLTIYEDAESTENAQSGQKYSAERIKADICRIIHGILTNPLIQGLALGALALIIRAVLPKGSDGLPVFSLSEDLPWLYQTISYLSRIATPLALIVLGGRIEMSEVKDFRKELISGVLMRLVGAPVIGFAFVFAAAGFGFLTLTPAVIATFVAVYGSPMAVASVVMAGEMHADEKLAGQIVVWTTIFGMASMFLLALIFRSVGLL